MKTILMAGAALTMAMALALPARAAGADAPETAQPRIKPIIDLRLRSEHVDQDGLAEDAEALTLRARLGFETASFANTTLLVEGEGLVALQDDYRPDPAIATLTNYPVVADDEDYEINRFQLTNTSLPGTTLTLGRQRILLDDQRFVGNSGWRQNEQTFDALRVVNKSVKNLVLDATYLNRVNRVNGPDSPQGAYRGDSFLLNAGYQTGAGKLSAFGYLLDFEAITDIPAGLNPVGNATATYGLRFAGDRPLGQGRIAYAASYARQTDHADNPLDFELDYLFAEVSFTVKQFGFGIGREELEGDGSKGFATPLSSLHKFQGWADKFTGTPANGIEDLYGTVSLTFKSVGPFASLGATLVYHDYEAEAVGADYGDELGLALSAKLGKASLLLKLADYEAGDLASARDTRKVWAQLEYLW